jgi:hypothetical protein
MNMKYKVGDKVKIREDLDISKVYGTWDCSIDMISHSGKIATIVNCYDNSYHIDVDDECYDWTDEMFEDISNDEIKARTVDVGYCLKPYGHRMIGNVYQGVDNNGKLFFTTVDGLNQYIIPKDAIDWIIPHPQEEYI